MLAHVAALTMSLHSVSKRHEKRVGAQETPKPATYLILVTVPFFPTLLSYRIFYPLIVTLDIQREIILFYKS